LREVETVENFYVKLAERIAFSCQQREIIKALEIKVVSDFKGLEYLPVTLPRQEPKFIQS
jgi:hypothetical protein